MCLSIQKVPETIEITRHNMNQLSSSKNHGTTPSRLSLEESPPQQLLEMSLNEMSDEIHRLRNNCMAYEVAASANPSYLRNRDSRLLFLKSSRFDAPKAALRMMEYLHLTQELFRHPHQPDRIERAETKAHRRKSGGRKATRRLSQEPQEATSRNWRKRRLDTASSAPLTRPDQSCDPETEIPNIVPSSKQDGPAMRFRVQTHSSLAARSQEKRHRPLSTIGSQQRTVASHQPKPLAWKDGIIAPIDGTMQSGNIATTLAATAIMTQGFHLLPLLLLWMSVWRRHNTAKAAALS